MTAEAAPEMLQEADLENEEPPAESESAEIEEEEGEPLPEAPPLPEPEVAEEKEVWALDGEIETKDPETGTVLNKFTYRKDILHGPAKIYNNAGQLRQELNYAKGVLDGACKCYDSVSGELSIDAAYKNGALEGLTTTYISGRKTSEIHYKEGVMHGPARFYGFNEKLNCTATYKDGVYDGEVIYYTEQEKPIRRITYVEGVRQGVMLGFYLSGALMEQGYYEEDLPHGRWVIFYENRGKNKKPLFQRVTHYNAGEIIRGPFEFDIKQNRIDEGAGGFFSFSNDGVIEPVTS